jgi:hypothetical protein
VSSNDGFLELDPAFVQASPHGSRSVADVARDEGLDLDDAMWLLRPDVVVQAEIPTTGEHEDVDTLALPELRRPADDAPIAVLLGHLVGLWAGRLRELWPWGWRTVWDSGVNLYQQHPDGRRRAKYYGPGHQPLDVRWLAGGERFDPRAISPPPGPSAVRPPATRAAAQAHTGRRRD